MVTRLPACQIPLRIGGPTATGRTTYSAIFTFRLVVSEGGGRQGTSISRGACPSVPPTATALGSD